MRPEFKTKRGEKVAAVVCLGVVVVLGLYAAFHFRVTTRITHFLPSSENTALAELPQRLADSSLSRTRVVLLEATNPEAAAQAIRRFAELVRKSPDVQSVRSGTDPRIEQEFYRVYFPRRYLFLSEQPEKDLPDRYSPAAVARAAEELKRELARPTGPLVRTFAAEDPLLTFLSQLKRLRVARSGTKLKVIDGSFVAAGRYGVAFVASRASAFATEPQRRIDRVFAEAFRHVQHELPAVVRLEQASVARFATDAERQIRRDVSVVSALSTVSIVLLFLAVFLSIRYLLVAMVPVVIGMVTALSVTLLMFGEVHGLTLAFGSALIGVCIDYPVHFFCHYVAGKRAEPYVTFRRIWVSLVLGAFTTVIGLVGLGWSSFPGIREVAVYAAVGVTSTLLATRIFVPLLVPRHVRRTRLLDGILSLLDRSHHEVFSRRLFRYVPAAVGIVVSVVGIFRVSWEDDLNVLHGADRKRLERDSQLRSRVGVDRSSQIIIATGKDDETALSHNDRLHEVLRAAVKAGELGGMDSLHPFVWSRSLQDRNWGAWKRLRDLRKNVTEALETAGFDVEMFSPFFASLDQEPPRLTLRGILHSPLGDLVHPFRIEFGRDVGIVTFLKAVNDPDALKKRLLGLTDMIYFDQRAFFRAVYREYRTRTVELTAMGLLAVFAVLMLRYRRMGKALAVFAPPVLATTATIGFLSLVGVPIHLFHVMACLLVLSMGVDYSIFLMDTAADSDEYTASLLGIVMDSLSTLISFGLLATSDIPALSAIGQTVGLGVLLSLVFAPTALVIFRVKPLRERHA